jgi:glycogen operon protein
MVKAFHKAGIEVILDVVYNHTAEGNENGPSFCFRESTTNLLYAGGKQSIFNPTFRHRNTLNANQPYSATYDYLIVLHFWGNRNAYRWFSFRSCVHFIQDEDGRQSSESTVLLDIETDPVFAGVKLIAEAWDAAGLYQVGSFVGDNWKEWNGRFRDDLRSFIKGDPGKLSTLLPGWLAARYLLAVGKGSRAEYNFVTCHDGFTLNDLVSYNYKHNEANGEDNGMEIMIISVGIVELKDHQMNSIELLRNRQVKNFICLTAFITWRTNDTDGRRS